MELYDIYKYGQILYNNLLIWLDIMTTPLGSLQLPDNCGSLILKLYSTFQSIITSVFGEEACIIDLILLSMLSLYIIVTLIKWVIDLITG
jgi:hypothetical protein